MDGKQFDLKPLLSYIDPASLNYSEWCQVGMGLKAEGYDCSVWDEWSQSDFSRYHRGECERKWATFNDTGITGATITQFAKMGGWVSANAAHEIGWDDEIDFNAPVAMATGYHTQEVPKPAEQWTPKNDLITYIRTLFRPGDGISLTRDSYMSADGKYKPVGAEEFTYEKILEGLEKHDDIQWTIGDYNPEAGAWICFNPISGNRKNENVTAYRYALVESDTMDLDAQYGLIKELQLPCAAIVHSGGKSIHAIVKIDAPNYEEYKTRVEYLYKVLKENHMEVDIQNKNPARLSRMPGAYRQGVRQYLIATDTGRKSWQDWIDHIAAQNDDYPEIETFDSTVYQNPPEMPPVAIDGLAYRGNLILLSGASKCGKTCFQLELCVSFAEGRKWMGRQCMKGKVLYINFEVDKAPFTKRIIDVYDAIGIKPENSFDVWHLRGTAVSAEEFVPRLLKRIKDKHYDVIIIDPLYKLNNGDENSAGDMSKLFNQLDKIASHACDEGATVVISHHYSKGSQSGKNAMDRASGSGVFARAPDLIIALDELDTTEEMLMEAEARGLNAEKIKLNGAYRVEYTCRYFPTPLPENCFFEYPIHVFDEWGILSDADHADTKQGKPKKSAEELLEDRLNAFEEAFASCSFGTNEALMQNMANALGVNVNTFDRKRLSEYNRIRGKHFAKSGEKVLFLG